MFNSRKYSLSLLLSMLTILTGYSQQFQVDSSRNILNLKYKPITGKSFILPGSLILTGTLLFDSQINKDFQTNVTPNDLTKKIHIDDYFQFSPAVIAIGLEATGVKGKHTTLQTSIIYVMSNIILNAVVIPTKHFSQELRPDSSNYLSFPSGHTTDAFANAELLRMEYRETQPWLGVVGYAMAVTTGYLRMYNNKHWISDVIAGAGIGIASTRLSYLIYEKVYSHIQNKKKSKSNTLLLPTYQNHQLGFNLVKRF